MGRRRFLFSGCQSPVQLAEFATQVIAVGGVYIEADNFVAGCTHVICIRLSRTSKVLGALAAGAWVLVPEYLSDCHKVRKWLREDKYEWCANLRPKLEPSLPDYFYDAPRQCREMVAKTMRGLFSGWVVAVFMSDRHKKAVYETLLLCGDAELLSLYLPMNGLSRKAAKLTHVFTDGKNSEDLMVFVDNGIPCLSPDYLRNFLFRGPHIDSDVFSIVHYTPDKDPLMMDLQNPSKKRRLISRVPRSTASVLESAPQALSSVSNVGSRRSRRHGEPSTSPSKSPSKRTKKPSAMDKCCSGPLDKFMKRPRAENKTPASDPQSDVGPKLEPKKLFASSALPQTMTPVVLLVDISNESNEEYFSNSHSSSRASRMSVRQRNAECERGRWNLKPTVEMVDLDAEELLETSSAAQLHAFGGRDAPLEKKSLVVAWATLYNAVHTLRDEIKDEVSFVWMTPASVSSHPDSLACHDKAGKVMCEEAPNSMSAILEACFETTGYELESIQYAYGLTSPTCYPQPRSVVHIFWTLLLLRSHTVSSEAFHFLKMVLKTHPPTTAKMQFYYLNVLCRCKGLESGASPASGWENISAILEILRDGDVESVFEVKNVDVPAEVVRRNCLMALTFVVRLLEMDFVSVAEKKSRTDGASGSSIPLVARLVWPSSRSDHVNSACRQLVGFCIDVASAAASDDAGTILSLDHCTRLLGLVAECCASADPKPASASNMLLPDAGHSTVALAHTILQCADVKGLGGDCLHVLLSYIRPTTLRMKVAQFYLDRRLLPSAGNVNGGCLSLKCITALHRACMKNDVEKVRALLLVPGINLDVADHAGWTPLHEACNHGANDCVREILSYQPAKPIEDYFRPGSRKPFAVNVLAASPDGVTPLHDAVINGHLEAARLLLQFGGKDLLKAKMVDGRTPVDMARSPRMQHFLQTFSTDGGDKENRSTGNNVVTFKDSQSQDNCATVGGVFDAPLATENPASGDEFIAFCHLAQCYVEVHRLHRLWNLVSVPKKAVDLQRPPVPQRCVRHLVDDLQQLYLLGRSIRNLGDSVGKMPDGRRLVQGLVAMSTGGQHS